MTQTEVDRIITKARGLCWHEWDYHYHRGFPFPVCKKCSFVNVENKYSNPDYSKWEHWGPVLEWIQNRDWWGEFIKWFIERDCLDLPPIDNVIMCFFNIMTCIKCEDRHGSFILAEFIIEHLELFGKEETK